MAADLLFEMKHDKDFMERFRSSSMIEIECYDPMTDQNASVRVPEAIACSLSGKISQLVGTGAGRTQKLDMDEVMEIAGPRYQFYDYFGDNVFSYLTWFVQWIYTSKLNYDKELRIFDMWIFSIILDCPRLQNEAVKMLSRDASWRLNVSLEEKKRQYHFSNCRFDWSISFCKELSSLPPNSKVDGFRVDGDIEDQFWESKKCLLFLLDCAAYFGPGDRRVLKTMGEDCVGQLSVMIMKRMVQLAKAGEEMCPWAPKNISRYLVKEKHLRSTNKETQAVQKPNRKRSAALLESDNASDVSNGAKRIRLDPASIQIKRGSSAEARLSDISDTLVGKGQEAIIIANRRS